MPVKPAAASASNRGDVSIALDKTQLDGSTTAMEITNKSRAQQADNTNGTSTTTSVRHVPKPRYPPPLSVSIAGSKRSHSSSAEPIACGTPILSLSTASKRMSSAKAMKATPTTDQHKNTSLHSVSNHTTIPLISKQ